ncbi:DUF418 domain-containing protein [Arenimonas oryziterrae]|uniref:DUF418 domain-containing protein n=1 Tax=Arenimonas oryziterrae DSM 21050 = YC6267 TaxID=1121015 RepID=A0A091BKI4_9GAMM|nr:DUF418 domain-containing protein [Arenimonas oryziterrae]KFN44825.1 hypothetical protein N789_02075 [Arenimonas oryziterrae DSM 21050 = YC6267]
MSDSATSAAGTVLAPVASNERIQALDVVRGFALVGIFLMNIEFFNRPLAALGEGLPATATGLNWLAGWLIYNFVQGKFWTMFSLLFGMGFAVMLTRAERAERNFLRPYLRRIAALAAFGTIHHIFIWGGDILFSYAVGATALLIVIYGRWYWILAGLVALIGIGFIPGGDPVFQVAASLALMGAAALFLRNERGLQLPSGGKVPVFSAIMLTIALLVAIVAALAWLGIGPPAQARIPLTIFASVLTLFGVLSAKFHDPISQRKRSLGVGMYLFPFVMMTSFGLAQWLGPKPADVDAAAKPAISASASDSTAAKAPVSKEQADADKKAAAERAEKKAAREKRLKEQAEQIAEERKILTEGSYVSAVKLRAGEFAEHAAGEAGFAIVIVGMFLLGAWFVRSGIMENTAAHLPLFRKLALFGIPIGCGLGLIGSAIATGNSPDLPQGMYQTAMGMTLIGNLPACLGYVGLMVVMLHSRGIFSNVRLLAPAGRMALTNYLTQSLIGTTVFYGYGLGYWGIGRAWQVVFVFTVFALQIAFSHWWLSKFRYGPMEWLWRAITYWQLPAMRRVAVD